MNSLYRSVSIYSNHYILLRLCSTSVKIMSSHSKAFFSGDRRSSTPINNSISRRESLSLESNDYEDQFPPLGASSKKKSGKGSIRSEADFASTNPSTPCKSSLSRNPESGKDGRDKILMKKRGLPMELYVPPGRRSETSSTDQFIKEEANEPAVKVGVGTSFKHKGNGSNPCKNPQFRNQTSGKDSCDQSSLRRQVLPSRVGRRSDANVTDQFTEEANVPAFGNSSNHTSSQSRNWESGKDASTNASTPCKSSQSQNWETGKDALSSQRNLECMNRGQSLIKRHNLHSEICAPVGRKSKVDLGSTDTFTPCKSAQSPMSCQKNLGSKKWDQALCWRPVLPHQICGPVDARNDSNVTDQFTREEAKRETVEVGIVTDGKHKRKALRKSIAELDSTKSSQSRNWTTGKDASGPGSNHRGNNSSRRRSTADLDDYNNPFTPNKHLQSQDWRICEDGLSSKKNHRNSGFKNIGQSPKRRPFDICSSFRKRNNSSIKDPSTGEEEADEKETAVEVLRPGMVLLKHYLSHDVEVDIVKTCRELGLKPSGFYQPGYTDGSKLRLQMMCLGRNWDPQTKYGNKTTETDNIPEAFSVLVEQAIREAQQALIDKESVLPLMSPDICIVNFYTETGRLGLHQDRDESRESIVKGLPIVSFSIGDSAEFLYGEERDVEKAEQVLLESGDVLIFGGESRMVFHGVKSIIPNSAPKALLDESKLRTGRLNLTFRQF